MGRDSNPRYAFDVHTLSREAENGKDPDVRSGFPSTDRAICRDHRPPLSVLNDSNGQQNGQQREINGKVAERAFACFAQRCPWSLPPMLGERLT